MEGLGDEDFINQASKWKPDANAGSRARTAAAAAQIEQLPSRGAQRTSVAESNGDGAALDGRDQWEIAKETINAWGNDWANQIGVIDKRGATTDLTNRLMGRFSDFDRKELRAGIHRIVAKRNRPTWARRVTAWLQTAYEW